MVQLAQHAVSLARAAVDSVPRGLVLPGLSGRRPTVAAPESQAFILIGMSVLVPIILGYTVFVYYTFRGKVRPGEGYH
jgi:cytochrome d ubiquinol oxidase subunit II